jgi:hypothetical protein
MNALVKVYITDNSMAAYGELKGFLLGSEGAITPWQQGYIVTVLAEIAGMNLPQASDDAVQMLKYMTNFVAGLYTNGENGYAQTNGAAYWLYLKDPIKPTLLIRLGPSFQPGMSRPSSSARAELVSAQPIPRAFP